MKELILIILIGCVTVGIATSLAIAMFPTDKILKYMRVFLILGGLGSFICMLWLVSALSHIERLEAKEHYTYEKVHVEYYIKKEIE